MMIRRVTCAGLAAMAVLSAGMACAQDLAVAVKATYLHKLAPFVAWPSVAIPGPGDPLVICVQDSASFAALVQRAVAGRRVDGHPFAVRRIGRVERSSGCQIAYLAGSSAQTASEAVAALHGAPVLTVTDELHGSARGVIHFVLRDGRVRFAIDPAKARAGRLDISSKLLALAVEADR